MGRVAVPIDHRTGWMVDLRAHPDDLARAPAARLWDAYNALNYGTSGP